MKTPTAQQLEALRRLREDRHLTEYLQTAREEYRDLLESEEDQVRYRKAQGSAYVLKQLLGHIFS